MKIVSWNVNGIQGILKKLPSSDGGNALVDMIVAEKPDVLCIQEIRCSENSKVDAILRSHFRYVYWNPSRSLTRRGTPRKGYSGVLIASVAAVPPLAIYRDFEYITDSEYGLDSEWSDLDPSLVNEGRVITLEFDDFVVVNVYAPNSGVASTYNDNTPLLRLDWRVSVWEPTFRRYTERLLATGKQIIIIGDLNVIAENIDTSSRLSPTFSGWTTEERGEFKKLLELGFIDSYRTLHPLERKYSWRWSRGSGGVRLDYALVSSRAHFGTAEILTDYDGSDHFPISISVVEAI